MATIRQPQEAFLSDLIIANTRTFPVSTRGKNISCKYDYPPPYLYTKQINQNKWKGKSERARMWHELTALGKLKKASLSLDTFHGSIMERDLRLD